MIFEEVSKDVYEVYEEAVIFGGKHKTLYGHMVKVDGEFVFKQSSEVLENLCNEEGQAIFIADDLLQIAFRLNELNRK